MCGKAYQRLLTDRFQVTAVVPTTHLAKRPSERRPLPGSKCKKIKRRRWQVQVLGSWCFLTKKEPRTAFRAANNRAGRRMANSADILFSRTCPHLRAASANNAQLPRNFLTGRVPRRRCSDFVIARFFERTLSRVCCAFVGRFLHRKTPAYRPRRMLPRPASGACFDRANCSKQDMRHQTA